MSYEVLVEQNSIDSQSSALELHIRDEINDATHHIAIPEGNVSTEVMVRFAESIFRALLNVYPNG
jgi:hypothetical protein